MSLPKSAQNAGDGSQTKTDIHWHNPRELDHARRPPVDPKATGALTAPPQAPQNKENRDMTMGLAHLRRRTLSRHQQSERSQPPDGPHSHFVPPTLPNAPASRPPAAASQTSRPVESAIPLFRKDAIATTAPPPFTTPGPGASTSAPATSRGFGAPGMERPYMAPFPRLFPQTQQLSISRWRPTLPKPLSDEWPTDFEEPEPQRRSVSPQVDLPYSPVSRSTSRTLVSSREYVDDLQTGSRQAEVVAPAWAPFRGPGRRKPSRSQPQASTWDMPSGDFGLSSPSSLAGYNDHTTSNVGENRQALPDFVDPKALTLPGLSTAPPHSATNPGLNGHFMDTSTRPGTLKNISAGLTGRGPRGGGTPHGMEELVANSQLERRKGSLLNPSSAVLNSSSPANSVFSSPAAQASLRRRLNPGISQRGSGSATCSPHTTSSQCLDLPHAPPMVNGVPLVNPREAIPDRFRTTFPYDFLNLVQSKCFAAVYETSENVVVAAPTGSGKTVLLELAICKLASQIASDNAKVVYVAPTKALCKEKAEQWKRKFGVMAMPVSEVTGDTSRAEMKSVREAKIIVTTPEKWDSLTRSWADHRRLLDLVELFLIDEVHILRESRGATLEAIVSRMKTYGAKVRFIALSATIPNSDDIATWLGRSHASPHEPAHREVFGEECRPVRLEKVVYGFDCKLGDHPFDSFLNGQLWKHIAKHSQQKPLLIFCMTRKSCRDAAEELAKEWSQRQPSARLWPEPTKRIPVIDANLQDLVRYGVAFHHAGLDSDDRKAIQQAFEQGALSVICCTSTLAVGINLPCHTVILKGTVGYQDGGQLCEYSDLEVMQMLGRAGRPQFGNSAVAIILTRSRNKKRYEDLGSGQQILESTLHKNLIEHLNSELSLGTFRNLVEAMSWLKGTFLSVRLGRNPSHYADLTEGTVSIPNVETSNDGRLEKICEVAIKHLQDACLIKGDPTFQSTDYGRAMSKYMIRFDTMKMILQLPRGASTKVLLATLCEASEFGEFRWQNSERELFREFNKDPFIIHPVEGSVATIAHKVSLLIQMELGHVEMAHMTGFARQHLRMETSRVLEVMHRLIRAVIECKGSDADGLACWAALELARSMAARAWEGRSMQLLQVPQLGPVLMRKLVSSNIRSVAELADTEAGTIERIASRNPPFGKKMVDSLASFPRLTIAARIKHSTVGSDGRPLMHVDALLGFSNTRGKWQGQMPLVTFIAVTSGGVSAYFWRDSLKTFKEERGNTCLIHFTWSPECVGEKVICRFACEEIVGTVVSTELGHNLPARSFPPRPEEPVQPHPNLRKASTQPAFDDGIDDDDILELMKGAAERGEEALDREMGENSYRLMDREGNIEETAQKPPMSSKNRPSQEKSVLMSPHDPIRLPNGRYKCGHSCSQAGGGKTARGHDCGHDCCRNGSKHPPRRGSKRKVQDEDAGSAEYGSGGDKSKPNPPNKHAKTSTESSFKAQATTTHAARIPDPLKPTMNLSAYRIDDDGFIDLTREDSLFDDEDEVFDKCNTVVVPADTRNGKPLNSKVPDTDNMLDGLSDDDFMEVAMNKEVRRRSKLPQHQSDDCSGEVAGAVITAPIRDKVDVDTNVVFETSYQQVQRPTSIVKRAKDRRDSRMADSGPEGTLLPESIPSDETLSNDTVHDGKYESFSRPRMSASQQRTDDDRPREKEPGDPAWVEEFDSDLIDEFRGLVDFI